MNKRILKFTSVLVLFFFAVSLLLPAPSFAEKSCWNDGKIAYAKGGVDGAKGLPQADINKRGRTEAADPVDVSNGNYAYQKQDLFVPSRGLPLEFTRYYNSLDGYEGPFGIGWSHSYNIFLLEVSDGSQTYVVRRNANGSKDKFLKNADGGYTASEGCYDTLTKETDGYIVRDKHSQSYNFDLSGKLKSITDRNQNQITLEYDAQSGVLIKVSDSLARAINFTYNAQHKLISIGDFSERATNYEYDQQGNLAYVTTPATDDYPFGLTTTYAYDNQHHLSSITDAKGKTYLYLTYDENSRVVELDYGPGKYYFTYAANRTTLSDPKSFSTEYNLNPNGTVNSERRYTKYLRSGAPAYYQTTYEYNQNRERTKIIYPRGNWVKYTYDDKGNLLEIRRKKIGATDTADPLNDIVTTFTYEPKYNFIKTITDPEGNVTTYTYDYELDPQHPNFAQKGNLIKIIYPTVGADTPVVEFTYNAFGQVETARDPNGVLTKYVYYPETGYLKQLINDFGAGKLDYTTEMSYDNMGNVTALKNARGDTTTFTYNALNQLIQVSAPSPFNYLTKYAYDENGNLKKLERQANTLGSVWQTTEYTYTSLDQLATLTDDLGNITTFNYDKNGNRSQITDGQGNTTSYDYDERDLLWKVTDALGNITEYNYDANANLSEIKDAHANSTRYAYDDFERLSATTYADNTEETYLYDKNSNLWRKTDQNSQMIAYNYDELNRLILKAYPDSSKVAYQYDPASRLTQVADASGAISYNYDALNRVTQVQSTVNGPQSTVAYAYDALGNRTKLTYPDNTYIRYEYDDLNRLTQVKDQSGASIATYTYDPLSRRSKLEYANNTQTTYQYDVINRLTQLANQLTGSAANYTYTYDKVGNRLTSSLRGVSPPQVADDEAISTYTYDNLYQLTAHQVTTSPSYQYNYDAVGNRTTTANGGTTTYTANAMNQYTDVDGSAYTYDANGNLTNDGTLTYAYDYENRLLQATSSTLQANYKYDAFGRRIRKSVDYGQSTVDYIYDGDQVIMETDATGTTTAKYIYGPGIDEPIQATSYTPQATSYYYHFDGLGSVTALTDTSGATVETYSYDVYGQPTIKDAAGSPLQASNLGNPYMFTGREYDLETSLYYYRARYYSPSLGRFLQRDPLSYISGINLYTYCYNNPINWIDPSGLKVYIGGHPVFGGGGHTVIILVPDNEEDFINDPRFTRNPITGKREADISAGPKGEKLIPYAYDVDRMTRPDMRISKPIKDPKGRSDTQLIKDILDSASLYANDLYYDPFALGGCYNSNSYVRGVLKASGINNPPLPGKKHFYPGWTKPISLNKK